MAKGKPASAVAQLKAASSPAALAAAAESEATINRIRHLEREAGSLRAANTELKAKYAAAENELALARAREDLLLATQIDEAKWLVGKNGRSRISRGRSTALLAWNDWHIGELVTREQTNQLNEYSLEIADARVRSLLLHEQKMLELSRGITDIRDGVLWLGGDLITGYLHDDQRESNSLSPVEEVAWVIDRVVGAIEFLLKECDLRSLRVVCSYGNHGRTTQKMRVGTRAENSFEWLAYQQIARYFAKNSRVHFSIPRAYLAYVDIQGWTVRLHHGDEIKYGGGIGGVQVPIARKVASWNKSRNALFDVIAHFHQNLELDWLTISNCLIGYSAYAVAIGAAYSPPSQSLIVVDKEHGKILSLRVFCE